MEVSPAECDALMEIERGWIYMAWLETREIWGSGNKYD